MLSLFFYFFAAANAQADTRTDAILNHKAITALEQIASCSAPQERDIAWRCTGAIKPVTKPEINATGCFFSVPLKCAARDLEVSGHTATYFLNSPQKTSVQPLNGGILIDTIAIK